MTFIYDCMKCRDTKKVLGPCGLIYFKCPECTAEPAVTISEPMSYGDFATMNAGDGE